MADKVTPREPDRFEAKARELYMREIGAIPAIAAALRAAESSALNAVRQYVEAMPECSQRAMLRLLDDLIPPAAAPAAETGKAQGLWRIAGHFGLRVHEDDVPVATFLREEDARRCVDAVNAGKAQGAEARIVRKMATFQCLEPDEDGQPACDPKCEVCEAVALLAARAAPPEKPPEP